MSVDGPPASGSLPQVQSPSLVGQILDGRYRITRKLGEGGMGEVYAAEHVHIEKRFAIKLLRQEIVSNPEAVTRFRQEARSSSSIGHRNIIDIEDFGQLSDGRIYMCMELLNGAALNDLLAQPIGPDRLLNILIQTGHGLAAAHAKGIIHRDMKPENIFVTIGASGEDVPKILDFGIAKVSGNDGQNHLTRTGTIFGTPFYMAPEQALGNPVDARTDIYAVGVIMYECFGGSLPFQGDSFMGILTQHITMEPEPIVQRAARVGRQLTPGLADVITRCMQKNPAQRFQTMDELVNVLIQIYRGLVGPGMSTYMEAFPVAPSAAYAAQPTPVPRTGPMIVGGSQPLVTAPHPSGSASGSASGPAPGVTSGSPFGSAPEATGSSAMATSSSSGGYAAPRSKAGLVVAVLAVLAVGGAVAAFVVMGNRREAPGNLPGSGSVAVDRQHGVGHGSMTGPDGAAGGPGSAKAPDVAAGSDRAGTGPDQAGPQGGSDHAGSGHAGSASGAHEGSAAQGSDPPAEEDVVPVPLFARNGVMFEVYENGVKLFDGPDNLLVARGKHRTVVIKARGFKDKVLIVDTAKKKVQFSLDRIVVVNGQGGSGHVIVPPPPSPGPDCSSVILEPRNKACVAQYCAKHPDEDKCQLQ